MEITAARTPREARRQERKARLVAAALRLFSTEGFNETSVDDIVAAARTSKSAFYEFWGSKEDCVRDQLSEQGGALIDRVFTAAAAGADHRDRLRRGIAYFVTECDRHRDLARVLLVESVGVSPAVEAARHAVQDHFAHIVEAEVRRNAAADAFYREIDPAVFGRAVVGAVYEATAYFLREPDVATEQLVRGLCAIFAPES
jgi:AcrR family transcriptional regulator